MKRRTTLRHCHRCGAPGHDRRTCRVGRLQLLSPGDVEDFVANVEKLSDRPDLVEEVLIGRGGGLP